MTRTSSVDVAVTTTSSVKRVTTSWTAASGGTGSTADRAQIRARIQPLVHGPGTANWPLGAVEQPDRTHAMPRSGLPRQRRDRDRKATIGCGGAGTSLGIAR